MRKLSEKLTGFRCERPSEWMMDEYITDALALEAENAQQAAIIAAIEKWAIRNKCFVSVEAFRENMLHRAALTKDN